MLILKTHTKLYVHYVTLVCNIKHAQDKDHQKVLGRVSSESQVQGL